MMLGTLAQRQTESGAGAWLPSGATAHLDFINGHYYAGGSERTLTTVIGGDGFDPSYITASGMSTPEDQSTNRPEAIGALFTDIENGLVTGMTFVFEFSQTTSAGRGLIFLDDLIGAPDWALHIERIASSGDHFMVWDYDVLDFREPMPELYDNGINRMAVTLSRNIGGTSWRYAVSGNGSAAQTTDISYPANQGFVTNGLTVIRIGGRFSYGWANGYIRTITLYPALTETALPALSLLPLSIFGTPVTTTVVGMAYSSTVVAVGGTTPYVFSLISGTLPAGLSLNTSTGAITGTSTTAGTSSGIGIRVIDDDGAHADLPPFDLAVHDTLVTLTDTRTDPSPSAAGTKTLPNVSYGTPHSSRIIAVMITGAGLTNEVSGVTISGTAATLGAKTSYGVSAAIYFRAIPTGTTGNVVVTVTDVCTIYTTVVALYGVNPTVVDSDTLVIDGFATSFNKPIDAVNNGIVLGVFGDSDKTVGVTWTGLDELNDLYPGGANQRHTTAYKNVATAATLSVTASTPSNVGGSLVLVSFSGMLPPGATAVLDFVNKFYYAGGAVHPVGDLLGNGPDTATAGGVFEPTAIITDGMLIAPTGTIGLDVATGATNRPYAAGAFLSDLIAGVTAGCTLVFETYHLNPPDGDFIHFKTASTAAFTRVRVEENNICALISDQSGNVWIEGASRHMRITGHQRVAVTLALQVGANFRYAVSANSEPAKITTVNYAPFSVNPIATAAIGHNHNNSRPLYTAYIRRITLYPAVDPSGLAALSHRGGVIMDPGVSDTKLTLGFAGADGSTTIPDQSFVARGNATVNGNAQVDTAQFKFGTGSLLLDGVGDSIQWPDHNDWRLSAATGNQFTVEGWFRFNTITSTNRGLACQGAAAGTRSWALEITSGSLSELSFRTSSNGTAELTTATTSGAGITTGVWYHIAVTMDQVKVVRIFVDGMKRAQVTLSTGSYFNSTQPLLIGTSWDGGYMDGWVDEFRITAGAARYKSTTTVTPDSFVVPDAAFPRT